MTTDQSARDRAQDAASTAADEGKHVAGTAKQEAGAVAAEAANQARSVLADAMSQVTAQSKEQKDRLAGTLRTLGDDLESMAGNGTPGMATDLARQVSERARAFSSQLENREPGELLDDVRRFARQRPGSFLLGALAAGVVVGRLARGAADGIAAAQADGPVTPAVPPTGGSPTSTLGETYVPSPSTEAGAPHGQPTSGGPGAIPAAPTMPSPPPMSTPEAGYGERGVLGDEGQR